jgi:hypothetical protein
VNEDWIIRKKTEAADEGASVARQLPRAGFFFPFVRPGSRHNSEPKKIFYRDRFRIGLSPVSVEQQFAERNQQGETP